MTRPRPARRRRSIAILLASGAAWGVAAWGGAPVWAQPGPGWTFEPFLSLSGEYDSNVSGSASDPQSDVIGTITPGVGLTYAGPQLSLSASYSIDAEVYAEQSELNNVGDNQRGALTGSYVLDLFTTVGLGLGYTRTGNSADFLQATPPPRPSASPAPAPSVETPSPVVTPPIGVDVGREESWALTVSPYATRRFGPATSGRLGYSYTHTEVSDGPSESEHRVDLSAAHAFTVVDRGSLRYTFRAFQEEAAGTATSHSLLPGWARQLTPQTSFFIEAGPHFEEGEVNLEATALLAHRFERGSAGLNYSREQTLVVGEAGAPIVDQVTAFIVYTLVRDLNVGLSASFSNIAEETGPDTRIYGLTAGAYYPITTWATASLTYRFTREDDGSDRINRHVVTLAMTFAYPIRFR